MPQANAEQLRAIEHQGGVVLEAGAGSGKTFVLKEHIAYLVSSFWKSQKELVSLYLSGEDLSGELSRVLKSFLREKVVMTFTKEAAGELAIRIQAKFEELLIVDKKQETLWLLAIESLSSLTVTTIDAFCFKLLKQGFFLDVDPDISLISPLEARDRVERYFSL